MYASVLLDALSHCIYARINMKRKHPNETNTALIQQLPLSKLALGFKLTIRSVPTAQ